ncbi:MAG: hypothetical protein KGL11_05060 [Alphaproteobacteria bacterium]|nr:hypothetical protein [Alphaproteobacteria bacterium]
MAVRAAPAEPRLGVADMLLLILFMIGIYTGYTLQISARIPFPSVPSGIAGVLLLWRRRDDITPSHLGALLVVELLYIGSVLSATDLAHLGKRFTGLIQITYSLVIAYALFLTVIRASRNQIAHLFLGFCIVIVIGCLLEDYAGLRPISDAVRHAVYKAINVYDADLRDEVLYGRIRPKLFTSEPSAVTFAYTLFAFTWLMTTRTRWAPLKYLVLMAVGIVVMPGPTLLLMVPLLVPYQLLRARSWTPAFARMALLVVFAIVVVVVFDWLGHSVFSERMNQIASGEDASFFYRVTGPALVARSVVEHHPFAGAGLTGEQFIANEVANVYMRSAAFSSAWDISDTASVLTNYFWLHWIYLGLVWGTLVLIGLSLWLKVLGVSSVPFCWMVWVGLGQASGAYVGPKTWTVLLLSAACVILVDREAVRAAPMPTPRYPRAGPLLPRPAWRRGGTG